MHTLYAGPFSRRRFVRGITLAGTAELLGHACKTEFHAWPVHPCSHASGCNTCILRQLRSNRVVVGRSGYV